MARLIHDPNIYMLGKKLPKRDPRDLKLATYLTGLMPNPPPNVNWGNKVGAHWGMLGNDQYGDCTCAAVAHAVMEFTADTGPMIIPTWHQTLALYTIVTGEEGAPFNWITGANDNGCVITDVLNQWRHGGFIGHRLGAYAAIHPNNVSLMKLTLMLFGGIDIGVQLPISAQSQEIWTVTDPSLQGDAKPGSWGGHSVLIVAYDATYLTCVTWGQRKLLTWEWLHAYCDEAWALLSLDWVSGNKPAPNGFNLAQLQQDLRNL
jgi:hypothetical protein